MKLFKILKAASRIVTIAIPHSVLIKLSVELTFSALEYLAKRSETDLDDRAVRKIKSEVLANCPNLKK